MQELLNNRAFFDPIRVKALRIRFVVLVGVLLQPLEKNLFIQIFEPPGLKRAHVQRERTRGADRPKLFQGSLPSNELVQQVRLQ